MDALRLLGFILLAIIIGGSECSAQETRLIFTTLGPADSRTSTEFFHPWADKINQDAKGALRIDVRDGTALASNENAYDRVMDDVIQISFGQHHYVAGKFPLTEGTGLPFLTGRADLASVALWRLYKSGMLDSEYNTVVPLILFIFPPSQLHMAQPLKSLDSLHGLKIITPSKIVADAAAALDGTPLSLPSGDIYEALQRGTADGTIVGWPTFNPRKLDDVTHYHVDAPLGAPTGMIFMAKKKYQSLSPAAQQALMANSGEAGSRAFGAWLDNENNVARTEVAAKPKQTVVTLDPGHAKSWQQKTSVQVDRWEKDNPKGKDVIDRFEAILADVTAGR